MTTWRQRGALEVLALEIRAWNGKRRAASWSWRLTTHQPRRGVGSRTQNVGATTARHGGRWWLADVSSWASLTRLGVARCSDEPRAREERDSQLRAFKSRHFPFGNPFPTHSQFSLGLIIWKILVNSPFFRSYSKNIHNFLKLGK